MNEYAAVLGHQPHISIAELAATVEGFSLKTIIGKNLAVFEGEKIAEDAIDHLGGILFLAERITDADVSMDDVPQILKQEVSSVKKKVTFSLRCFQVSPKDVRLAYKRGKEVLRKADKACRYIGSEKKPAPTAAVLGANIVGGKKGCELLIINQESGLWIGKTIGVQNIDDYTWRDIEKPVRDTTVGLLPPKLAQVMLNFGAWQKRQNAEEKPKKTKRKKKEIYTVFDPFCGTGVIPLECMLRGWNVVASDVAQKAVNGTKKNVEWMRKERKILKKDVSDTVSKHDATKEFTLKDLPDMVVTETSLGPNLEKRPTKKDVTKLKSDNEKLQEAFLKNVAATLPGVPLVCTWPFWRMKDGNVYLEKIWDKLENIGYKAVMPDGVEVEDEQKPSLPYQRKDQFVGRQIVLLQPLESTEGK